ncbi:MAG: hypothetical protein A3G33_02710 [Omnitrophica bacterium RIFCSPLOWO2_12_FULL_44_17]|uniref:Uncharacterized protein n=1 Tax=Candidatus Danuiimicrobium aquiferis TaxID=1801832 RepID=A0A1G1KRD6_9BACT|nr:MAG: hypothetical protein A3E74_08075 [Omnitrophica bacterium RIFCSPHIGHO2_12_FULL_44_12]OGW95520.1 MAG: hypothetical protein A3G33_02710 [Omnitrophica bacterium RIFCSPLOWO2_12_FULL_44_17]OGX01612.1 MAG: hypothetical protein A3J12_05805 [Omnitrophica bacterium RIFCSPLOWO2_02_FULL_44_11]
MSHIIIAPGALSFVAILFNPFLLLDFDEGLWRLIDFGTSILLIVYLFRCQKNFILKIGNVRTATIKTMKNLTTFLLKPKKLSFWIQVVGFSIVWIMIAIGLWLARK